MRILYQSLLWGSQIMFLIGGLLENIISPNFIVFLDTLKERYILVPFPKQRQMDGWLLFMCAKQEDGRLGDVKLYTDHPTPAVVYLLFVYEEFNENPLFVYAQCRAHGGRNVSISWRPSNSTCHHTWLRLRANLSHSQQIFPDFRFTASRIKELRWTGYIRSSQ